MRRTGGDQRRKGQETRCSQPDHVPFRAECHMHLNHQFQSLTGGMPESRFTVDAQAWVKPFIMTVGRCVEESQAPLP
ncbi:hypothetical protein QF032_000941 [Streptomyces achromogenes]|uniref:Uncharacterized protein n=1 Tax=Streptomyces achromogenes TaxID=67255 RepID=A0ABU0PU85_STRAH|nr:hypothetical protein [Streptomyces achromogenes]MDQ0829097.1 hypothetical protein [Streptomyces achromogenes]